MQPICDIQTKSKFSQLSKSISFIMMVEKATCFGYLQAIKKLKNNTQHT